MRLDRSLLLKRSFGDCYFMCQLEGTVDPLIESQARKVVFLSCGKKLRESSDTETSGGAPFDLAIDESPRSSDESFDTCVCTR